MKKTITESKLREMIREQLLQEFDLIYTKGKDGKSFSFKITIPVTGKFYERYYSSKSTKKPTNAVELEARYDTDKMKDAITKELSKAFAKIVKPDKGGKYTVSDGQSAMIGFAQLIKNEEYIEKTKW